MPSYSRNSTGPQTPKITVADTLYAVFRHKWKILFIAGLGMVAAAIVPRFVEVTYQSDAKLFVKYVVENKSPGQVGSGSTLTSDESANAINTEMEILTSLDLAQEVADKVGPEKILAKVGGGTNRYAAAGFIHGNLTPESAKGSKVIRVSFRHPDPEMVQTILNQIIQAYLTRHEEIHRHVGLFDDFLTQQTDQLKARLKDTEEELRRAKTSAGIISLEDSKRAYTEQISSIEEKITEAEANLAERKAMAEEMAKLLHTESPTAQATQVVTNQVLAPENIAAYEQTCALLETQKKRLQDLLVQFTPENSWVKDAQAQVEATLKRKQNLETSSPGLLALRIETTAAGPDANAAMRTTLMTEAAKATALQSKIDVFIQQLARIRKEAGTIDDAEASITELQRTRQLQERNYEYFKENLEQSKFDQALGAGRAYNISIIQEPSPSYPVSKAAKIKNAIMAGSIAAALALAFLIEFVLDKTVKRPGDVTKLALPLFLCIPRLGLRNKPRLKSSRELALPPPASPESKSANGHRANELAEKTSDPNLPALGHPEIDPWGPRHVLRPFCEALADRLITHFEINNLTHKPKLVAVTSCTPRAGVSTVATGLAASLSETGDGNVLLVDMGEKNGAVHQFYKGDLACGLDNVLEKDTRNNALVRGNLYVVSETTNGENLPVPLPKRFKNLVPKLRASDYDYIIFDMPSVTQVSATPRLARFMDFVVMTVESEKTNRDLVKQACALLAESKANVGVVLNKQRPYVPKWLHQQL